MKYLIAMCLTWSLPAAAQLASTAPAVASSAAIASRPARLIDRVHALDLPRSTGTVTAHYAVGYEAHANRLRALIESAMAFYSNRLNINAPLHLAVLTRTQWNDLIPWQPYGIPGVAGNPPVIFMPATDDGLAAEDALSLRGRLSPTAQARLEAAGMSFEYAARRYVDLVGLHELGHAYARAYGIRVPSRWLDEWVATYFAHAFMVEREPAMSSLWQTVLQVYLDGVEPAYASLADFDRLYFGVGAQTYVWYQAQFQRRVAAAYDVHGLALLDVLREEFESSPAAPLDAALVISRLEQRNVSMTLRHLSS